MPGPANPIGPKSVHVVIAGGGVAGLEAALALHDLAGARVSIDLLAPHRNFIYRPMAVLEPFRDAPTGRFALNAILNGCEVHHGLDSVTCVDRSRRQVHTRRGRTVGYDALLLCPGARAQPSHPQAITISGESANPALRTLVAEIDAGAVKRVAFIVPPAGSWQLPLYEFALLTAARARDRGQTVALSIFTAETSPLEAFGDRVARSIRELLADAGIDLLCRALCRMPEIHSLLVDSVDMARWPRARPATKPQMLDFDRVLALPRLRGPRVRGVPAVSDGFIPVDTHGRILGANVEFAAGDATNCPVKHESVAAQQADAAARAIAALAGADVTPSPFRPVATDVLVTGGDTLQLSAAIVGGHSVRSRLSTTDSPGADKLDAPYLSSRLAPLRAPPRARDVVSPETRSAPEAAPGENR